MAEIDFGKLGLVEEGGNEVADAGHVNAVDCKRVRNDEKKHQVPKDQAALHNTSQPHKLS